MTSSSTVPVSSDSTGSPKFQLTRDQFEEHEVWKAYKDYLQPGDAQDPNFENFYQLCLRFGYIPSLDTIDWIIREANLIDPSCRLQFPVYAFLQEFKFDSHVAQDTDQPRMLVAHFDTEEKPCPIWAGWSWSDEGGSSKAEMKLYLQPHADEFGVGEVSVTEDHRVAFKWEEPFQVLFKLGEYEPTHVNASVQDTILLSVAKVLARFPGLVRSPPGREDSGPWLNMRTALSSRPFDVREASSPLSPWWNAYNLLISGTAGLAEIHAYCPPSSGDLDLYIHKEVQERAELFKMVIDSTNSVSTAPNLGNGVQVPGQPNTITPSIAPQSTEMDIDHTNPWTLMNRRWRYKEELKANFWKYPLTAEVPAQSNTITSSTAPQSTEMDVDHNNGWTLKDWQWRYKEELKANIWKCT